jgi:hypothetical protein
MESVGCTPDRKAREILHNVSLILRQRLGCEFFTLHVFSFLSMRMTTVKPLFFLFFFLCRYLKVLVSPLFTDYFWHWLVPTNTESSFKVVFGTGYFWNSSAKDCIWCSENVQFFYNNYSNNFNFNNKRDKIKSLRIQMAAPLPVVSIPLACLCKDVTGSDVFQFFLKKNLKLLLGLGVSG